jgi:hypothetical protein
MTIKDTNIAEYFGGNEDAIPEKKIYTLLS